MTSLSDRTKTAVLVVDMQVEVVRKAHDVENVVATINSLVDCARTENVPVVWVQHADDDLESGSPGWQLVPELVPLAGEPVVHKEYGDSFEQTDLETLLADRAVGRVVVTGAQTDACIRSTLHGALVRGYDVTLVADGHTTSDMREWGSPIGPEQSIGYTNLYWKYTESAGRRGDTAAAAEIDFAG